MDRLHALGGVSGGRSHDLRRPGCRGRRARGLASALLPRRLRPIRTLSAQDGPRGHFTAAFIAGAALGIGVEAGAALLVYAEAGFLATVGLLTSLALGALGAGLWVGAPESGDEPGTLVDRWLVAGASFLAAGIFALFWIGARALSQSGAGKALAVLLLLAAPSYTVGTVLMGVY